VNSRENGTNPRNATLHCAIVKAPDSDIIDAWVAGKKRVPVLIPSSMPLFEPDPALEQGAIAVA
jgi:hypothetical protein